MTCALSLGMNDNTETTSQTTDTIEKDLELEAWLDEQDTGLELEELLGDVELS